MSKILLLKKMKQAAPPLNTMMTVEREQGERGPRPGGEGPVSTWARKGPTSSRDTGRGRCENREASSGTERRRGAVGGSGSGSYLAGMTVRSTCWLLLLLLLRRARSDQGLSTDFHSSLPVAISGRASVSRQCRGTGTK